ncbi:MAG: hypothetical protein A2808_03435 [Candidatus Moranbacteria bacterium RIFCSPHIGHO2_01_FULL_55_24]|nr:MAG: hypothetical protein A2808_03435 [Candidatus Moranbacteria bacterium RIFCSPHIGHO2_01_FULL_55_24]
MPQKSLMDRIAYSLSAKSRAKKYAFFLKHLEPMNGDTILDVGVNTVEYSDTDNYLEKHYPFPKRITAVGLDDFTEFKKRYPEVTTLEADGRSLPFTDNEFSIAYSNAVIEHVGGHEDQLRFLRELFRVSRRGYLTTPNRRFPIEVHTRIPLLHLLLPKKAFDRILRLIGKGWAAGGYMDLLSEYDLRNLFDEAGIRDYTLSRNRLFGFTMTFTVVWHKA